MQGEFCAKQVQSILLAVCFIETILCCIKWTFVHLVSLIPAFVKNIKIDTKHFLPDQWFCSFMHGRICPVLLFCTKVHLCITTCFFLSTFYMTFCLFFQSWDHRNCVLGDFDIFEVNGPDTCWKVQLCPIKTATRQKCSLLENEWCWCWISVHRTESCRVWCNVCAATVNPNSIPVWVVQQRVARRYLCQSAHRCGSTWTNEVAIF